MTYTDRQELKYLIDYQKYIKIIKFIKPIVEKDKFGDKESKYIVNSLYYDTSSNKFYWEKIDGEKKRRKIRIRSYINKKTLKTDKTIIEIKKKNDRNVYKEKVSLNFEEAIRFIESPVSISTVNRKFSKEDLKVIDNISYLNHKFDLKPKIMVCYERQAFVDKYYPHMRITFDFNIRCRKNDFNTKNTEMNQLVIQPNNIIMEIKHNKALPLWTSRMIKKFDLEYTTISKYCEAMNKLVIKTGI